MNKRERQEPPYKLAISISEFAEMLGVSRPTAYEIIRRSDFQGAFKLGKRTLISMPKAQEWIEKQVQISERV